MLKETKAKKNSEKLVISVVSVGFRLLTKAHHTSLFFKERETVLYILSISFFGTMQYFFLKRFPKNSP